MVWALSDNTYWSGAALLLSEDLRTDLLDCKLPRGAVIRLVAAVAEIKEGRGK